MIDSKKKAVLLLATVWVVLCSFGNIDKKSASHSAITLGAYYFDGWSGAYKYHLTDLLQSDYSNRMSKWGWITSTQYLIDAQINSASEGGLSFFSFCWYFNGRPDYKEEPLNRSLRFYNNSKYKSRLKYCLMVANHKGYYITPENWNIVSMEFLKEFKSTTYLRVDDQPLLVFFSIESLVHQFGSTTAVKNAFTSLKNLARRNGLKGVNIAVCTGPGPKELKIAELCGVDILTGYNYHSAGLDKERVVTPIDSMQVTEKRIWSRFSKFSKLPLIPVITLNWDPRPWSSAVKVDKVGRFENFSPLSVFTSVCGCREWIAAHRENVTKDNLAIMYAWNEYGEGAYLTPTKDGVNFLDGVKRALQKK